MKKNAKSKKSCDIQFQQSKRKICQGFADKRTWKDWKIQDVI